MDHESLFILFCLAVPVLGICAYGVKVRCAEIAFNRRMTKQFADWRKKNSVSR